MGMKRMLVLQLGSEWEPRNERTMRDLVVSMARKPVTSVLRELLGGFWSADVVFLSDRVR